MTTVEVVEAVQRTLENEGILQIVRAQLRANVLRIISSGPDYTPTTGKVVSFVKTSEGFLAIQLVKDLLEQLDLKETLSVFNAESGQDTGAVNRTVIGNKLNLRDISNEGCLLSFVIKASLATNTSAVLDIERSFSADAKDTDPIATNAPTNDEKSTESGAKGEAQDSFELNQNEYKESQSGIAGDTLHALGESDYDEEDEEEEDMQSYSQVDAVLAVDEKGAQPNASERKESAERFDASSSFEQSYAADQKQSNEFDLLAKGSDFDGEKKSSVQELDTDTQSIESTQQPLLAESKQTSETESRSNTESKIESRSEAHYDADNHEDEPIVTKSIDDVDQAGDAAEGSSDEDAEGVPEYNSDQEDSKEAVEAIDSEFDVRDQEYNANKLDSNSHTRKIVLVAGIGDELEEGKSTEALDSAASLSSAGSSVRASISRLSQNAVSRSQRGWDPADNVGSHEEFSAEDEALSLTVGKQPSDRLKESARNSKRADLEVADFDADSDSDDSRHNEEEEDEPNRSMNQEDDQKEQKDSSTSQRHLDENDDGDSSFDNDASDVEDSKKEQPPVSRGAVMKAFEAPTKLNDEEDYGDEDFDEDFEDDGDNPHNESESHSGDQDKETSSPRATNQQDPDEDDDDVQSVEDEISIGQDSEGSEEYGISGQDAGPATDNKAGDAPLFQTRSNNAERALQSRANKPRTNFDYILNDDSDEEEDQSGQHDEELPRETKVSEQDPTSSHGNQRDANNNDEESLASENLDEFSTGGGDQDSDNDEF